MLPNSRKEAIRLGVKHYFTGKPCKHGHLVKRYTSNGRCMICQCDAVKKNYRKDPSKAIARAIKRNRENPERARAVVRRWCAAHPENLEANYQRWKDANPTGPRDNVRRWRIENPLKSKALFARRKARERNAKGTFDGDDLKRIMIDQEETCFYCEESITEDFTIDHFIPLARGGTNWPDNLRLACLSCNAAKGAKLPNEFVPQVRRY